MQRTPPFPPLPDLKMPLRDAMRGVANFAEATEEALEPASKLLPEPLREGFYHAIKSIESTGRQLMERPIQHSQIHVAGDFATGATDTTGATEAAKDFAKVVCHAWEHLQHASHAPRYLISETIITSHVAQLRPAAPGAAQAAALLDTIRSSAAVGRLPGLPDGLPADARVDVDMALVAIMVWLLSARADSLSEEFTLLDLAAALVTAIRSDIVPVLDDPARLADILNNTSAHL